MGTFVAEPVQPPPPSPPRSSFLREWSLGTADQASCAAHKHLALIYDNQEEQLNFIVPFLRLGLERGEKGVYIVDDSKPETVIAAMERHGINVEAATASGALSIITKYEAYLKNGDFDPDWMIDFLAKAVEDAKTEGFEGVRASGEMTWALGPSGDAHGRLLEYECKVDKFFAGYDMSGICQYNRRRFRAETLMYVIHTHPRIVFRGEVCENPYYIPTEIHQIHASGVADPVQRLLESMAENTRLRRQLDEERQALRRTEKLAAAGQMAATVAHEINNPLESVTNLWYLINQESNLSPAGRSFVEMMGKELARVSHITKQTLEFYKVGASKDRVDPAEIVQDSMQLLSQRAQAQGCAIAINDRAKNGVFGFANELRQLFLNLLTNALEAGSSKISIRVSDGRDWKIPTRRGVRITIADNAHGIPKAALSHVFEPFFTTKETKGTGLGLWVSNGIVRKHDGAVSMRTSTNIGSRGTAFSIFLPSD